MSVNSGNSEIEDTPTLLSVPDDPVEELLLPHAEKIPETVNANKNTPIPELLMKDIVHPPMSVFKLRVVRSKIDASKKSEQL